MAELIHAHFSSPANSHTLSYAPAAMYVRLRPGKADVSVSMTCEQRAILVRQQLMLLYVHGAAIYRPERLKITWNRISLARR